MCHIALIFVSIIRNIVLSFNLSILWYLSFDFGIPYQALSFDFCIPYQALSFGFRIPYQALSGGFRIFRDITIILHRNKKDSYVFYFPYS